MCKFCDALMSGNEIIWNGRNVNVKNNIHKTLGMTREEYMKDTSHFSLNGVKIQNGNTYVMLEYLLEMQKNGDNEKIIVSPFSESLQINFCPFCGLQLSKDVVEFENSRKMYVVDK